MPVDFNSNTMNERTNYLPQYENFKTWTSGNANTITGEQTFKVFDFQFQMNQDKAAQTEKRPNRFQFSGIVGDIFANGMHVSGLLRVDVWMGNDGTLQTSLTLNKLAALSGDPTRLYQFRMYTHPHNDAAETYDIKVYCKILQHYATLMIQPLQFNVTGYNPSDWKYNDRNKYLMLKKFMADLSQTGITDDELQSEISDYTEIVQNGIREISSANNDSVINIAINTELIYVGSKDGGQKTIGQIVPPASYSLMGSNQIISILNFNNVILQAGTTIRECKDNKLILPDNKAYQMHDGEVVQLMRYGNAWIMIG